MKISQCVSVYLSGLIAGTKICYHNNVHGNWGSIIKEHIHMH